MCYRETFDTEDYFCVATGGIQGKAEFWIEADHALDADCGGVDGLYVNVELIRVHIAGDLHLSAHQLVDAFGRKALADFESAIAARAYEQIAEAA